MLGLARRCNWAEAARPPGRASSSLDLFDATAELHGLDAADRELLEFAALLHDIGEHVASSGHHKHGAYLVRNGQLRGFAPDEIELLAAVVRWHRRGEPRVTDEFPLLDADAIERVRALAAILRVADGLDRSRNQNVYGVDAMVTPSLVLLRVARARRRRARDLGRPPQARAAREGARPRARAHHPSRRRADPPTPAKGGLPCARSRSATNASVLHAPATRSSCARRTTATRSAASPRAAPSEVDARGRGRASARTRGGPLPPWRRAEILDRAARLLAERTEEFAAHHRRGGGQADQDRARRGRSARCRRSRSRRPRRARLAGEMVPIDASDVGEGKLGFTLRVPIGVVGAISPFNFPLNLVAHKVAPAIAAGCPVVLKPASQTPLSAIALAELLLDECGLPAGHLNVVTGSGGTVGNAHRRPPRHRAHHVHRLARGRLGHQGARRRARRSGSSSATTRR